MYPSTIHSESRPPSVPHPYDIYSISASADLKVEEVSQSSFKNRVSKRSTALLLLSATLSIIKEVTRIIIRKIIDLAIIILKKIILSKNRLIESKHITESVNAQWLTNLALMREAAENPALTPAQKQQIQFLATNYLHKIAPIHTKTMRLLFHKTASLFQASGLERSDDYYHRTSLEKQIEFGAKFNRQLALGDQSPLFSTDTIDLEHLFSLKFEVIQQHSDLDLIANNLLNHYVQNPTTALNNNLQKPFLVDLTSILGNKIEIKSKEDEAAFIKEYATFKKSLYAKIEEGINALVIRHPALGKHKSKLRTLVKRNMTCICRLQTENTTGIKVLPLFQNIKGTRVLKVHHDFAEFIKATGIGIGGVNLQRKLVNALEEYPDVKYAVKSSPKQKSALYYQDLNNFTSRSTYQRLLGLFGSVSPLLQTKPHIHLLGKATMDLLNGILSKVPDEKWHAVDPLLSPIIQASLYRIHENLAMAELHLNDYKDFAQHIELIHAEIATILEIMQPYKKGDFEEIFSQASETMVPVELRNNIKSGLGKTSVNVFSAINAALHQSNPHFNRVYSKGFYFEQAAFVGYSNSFDEALQSDKKIDLYCGQFNPNIEIDSDFTHYERRDIAQDLRDIVAKGLAAKQLTIAIDFTIDDYQSENVKNLLEEFKKEIKEGKFNFIFFRSGQKLDILGMDNYYGAPFLIINNGESHWNAFDSILRKEAHQTDILSEQWFCLSNEFMRDGLGGYRRLIFENTRKILDNIPQPLKPAQEKKQLVHVNTASDNMRAAFIDIKVLGANHRWRSKVLLGKFYQKMLEMGIKVQTRATFGLYHVNAIPIATNAVAESSSIRLHPSLDQEENKAFIEYFNELALSQ